MPRQTVAVIFTSEPNFDEFAFKYFLLSLNKAQTLYEFIFPETHEYLFSEDHYETQALFSQFTDVIQPKLTLESKPDYFINVIKPTIANNLFFVCGGNVSFVTTDTWDKLFSPPSLFEYLFHCTVASLLFLHPKIHVHSHHETRGCYFDYTFYKTDDKVDIVLGYICQSCQAAIVKGVGEKFLAQIAGIIDRSWLGDVSTHGTIAYNLKKFFAFDIDKDSGFNKNTWEKIREHLYEVPKEAIAALIGGILGYFIGK